jgi:hypothetical protein
MDLRPGGTCYSVGRYVGYPNRCYVVFLSPYRHMMEQYPKLGYERFLLDVLQFF